MKFDFSQNVGHSFREKDTVVILFMRALPHPYQVHIQVQTFGLVSFLLLIVIILTDTLDYNHELYRDIIHKAYIIQ